MTVFADSFRVAWIDLCFIKRNILTVLVTSLVGPLLYLFAFGYGLGRGMTVEGFDYLSFMIPGIIALSTLSACFNTVATKVMVQRNYYQSFDELFLCSMAPSAIILGKAYAGVIRGLISCTVLYIIGLAISPNIMLTASAIILIPISCLLYSLLGVVSGLLANSHLTLTMFTSLVILPMTFLCGTIFSLDSLPEALKMVIYALPLTHSTECIRSAILGTTFPWTSLIMIICYGFAFFLVCRYLMIKGRV